MVEQKGRRKALKQCVTTLNIEWFFSIRTWKTDLFYSSCIFHTLNDDSAAYGQALKKYPFTSLFCSSISTKLGSKRPRASVRGFLSLYVQASWKPCGVRARNPYVRNKRIRRADTSMYVYPYAFMHICGINIQNMALSTSHEGNSLCVYLPSALKVAILCDWKSWIRMRKRTHIRAYESVPFTFFFFLCHMCIWGKMPSTEIIITLFQEDNIFGTNASLTYGPQIQRHTCVW